MKRMVWLLMLTWLCTSCTALPAEERAFAVALCVEKATDWHVYGRIPTYQTGGGYSTISGKGDTLAAALADLDVSAPMHVNYSQLRLLILSREIAASDDLYATLLQLSERQDMRQQCAVAVTVSEGKRVADALVPTAGARLSKALDLMLDTRIEQGAVLPASLAEIIRMGERQSPVFMQLTLDGKEISLSGGICLQADNRLGKTISADETALLSMLLGQAKSLRLSLPEGTMNIHQVTPEIHLHDDMQRAGVTLALRVRQNVSDHKKTEQILAEKLLGLLDDLYAEGSDVLGLGRQAMQRQRDIAQWRALDWPQRSKKLRWTVSVRVSNPT